MKYNIQIMSKQEITLYSTRNLNIKCIVISINDSGNNTVIYKNPYIIDVLTLHFDDITEEQKMKYKLNSKLVTREDIKQIKEFVDKYKDNINTIIVHCTAGISRSGAVGCVLARYLNDDDMYLFENGKYMPNETVYRFMCEEFNLEWNKKEFKNKCRISNKKCREQFRNDYGQDLDDMFI